MQDVTPLLFGTVIEREEPSYAFLGGASGFLFYLLSFAIPFTFYGANALFLLLIFWPFFLALMPVAVLLGVVFSTLLQGRLLLTLLSTAVGVVDLFCLLFSCLWGW